MEQTFPELLKTYRQRGMPLRSGDFKQHERTWMQQTSATELFPDARFGDAAWCGFLLLMGYHEESHNAAQKISSPEGNYWHAIIHRLEGDPFNTRYWFDRVGRHPIFPALHSEAQLILDSLHNRRGWRLKKEWDPMLFFEWCQLALHVPGGPDEKIALRIQMAEWNCLFDWCTAPAHR